MLYPRQTNLRLALKLFRGEPAISELDWNFSAIHRSGRLVRSSMKLYLHFNLPMDRSPGFGSTSCNYIALFRLALASAPNLKFLTSLHNVTRRSVLQKVHGRPFNGLPLLVNTGFQVLFHSPPGVLFTFPSRYYALSVTDRL